MRPSGANTKFFQPLCIAKICLLFLPIKEFFTNLKFRFHAHRNILECIYALLILYNLFVPGDFRAGDAITTSVINLRMFKRKHPYV